tara:strand:+ start:13684 stop:18108 length:4425 start_codon:yes stop_codon:yes gene_type:complete
MIEVETNKRSLITPPAESKRDLISPVVDKSLISPPSKEMLSQAKFIIDNSKLEKELHEEKIKTLSMQTSKQLRESFNIQNQQNLSLEINESLRESGVEFIALGLETLSKKRVQNQAALEEEFVKAITIQAEKDPVTRYIMENDRSFFSNLAQESKKQLAISNKLEEIKSGSDWGDTGLNLVSEVSMVSFLQRTFGFGLFDYASELRDLQVELEKADADEAIEILNRAEKVVKATQILGDNPDYVHGELALAFEGSRGSQDISQLLHFFDFADTGLILKDVLKVGRSIVKTTTQSKVFNKMGNEDAFTDAVAEGDRKIIDDEVEQISAGLGLKTEFDEATGLSGLVRASHAANRRILDEVLNEPRGVDYQDVQDVDTLGNLKAKLKREFNKGTITDVTPKSDGTTDIMMVKQDGSGYVSEATAKTAIKKNGFSGEPTQLPSGKWAIKANLPSGDVKNANMSTAGVSWFTRMFRRPETWIDDDLLVYSQMSEASLNRIVKQGQIVYDSTLGQLGKADLKSFLPAIEDVLRYGEETKEWLSPKDFDAYFRQNYNRPATAKEMNAYSGYRLLNDFQYELDNKVLYQKKQAQGYGTIMDDDLIEGVPATNAKLVDSFTEHDYIFSRETGQLLDKNNLEKGFLDKYDVIKVDDPIVLKSGQTAPTPYIAVPKGTVKIEPLQYKQLTYLAGGRKRYDKDTVFLKQANVEVLPNGKKYRKKDGTFFTASSLPQGKKVQEEINAINSLLRKGRDDADIRKQAEVLIQKNLTLGIDNVADWLLKMDDEFVDIGKDIQAVRNRGVVSGEDIPTDFVDDVDFMEQMDGRLGRRSEGGTRSHVDSTETSLLNPIASLNQNFVAAAQNASLSAYKDYTLAYLERYRKYFDIDMNSPRMDLLDAKVKDGTKLTSKQIEKIEGEQQFAREVMGQRTAKEVAAQATLENNIEWALGRLPDKLNLGIGTFDKNKVIGASKALSKEAVLGKVRGLIFNAKLGLFSLPAMAIQAIHAPIIAIMAPTHGIKALMTYPVLRMALLSRDPQVVAEFAKKSEVLGLTGFGDMQKFFQEFRNLGFDSFGPNMAYENAGMGDNIVRSTASKVVDKGRVFFEEGELLPRLTGYATAVREWKANFKNINPKGVDIDSKEASKYISQRVNTLTLGMTRADLQQGLKTGWTGLATQFQSYPLRALDAMVFPSKGLSGAERARMVGAYAIFFGGAGLPMLDSVVNTIVENTDVEENKALTKTLYNGVIDGLVMAATGEDTNFASRGGLGDWAKELMKLISGDQSKPLDVLLGPAGSTGGGALDTLIQYAQAHSAGYNPDPSQLTTQVIMDMAKQVSSFNNLYRTWVAYNTGKIYDSRGNQFIEISNTKNLLQILGVPPQEYANVGALFAQKEKRKQIIDLNVEMLLKLHTDFLRADTYEERESIKNEINGISTLVQQDGLSQEVMPRVANKMGQGTKYNKLILDAKLLEATGKNGLSTEMEALND